MAIDTNAEALNRSEGIPQTTTTATDTLLSQPPAYEAPAGWYADPTAGSVRRCWDGARWWTNVKHYFNIGFITFMLAVNPLYQASYAISG